MRNKMNYLYMYTKQTTHTYLCKERERVEEEELH